MKKTRLYINGERKKDIYIGQTKWAVFKHKVKNFFKKVIITSLVIATAYGIFQAGQFINPEVVYQVEAKEVIKDNLTPKIETLKKEVVADIKSCETPQKSEEDGVIIFDSNNKASIGLMQFQITTVQHYYKLFYGESITRKDAILIALDKNKAEALATDIIFKETNGWKNWFNCGVKFKIGEKVALIKQLEK